MLSITRAFDDISFRELFFRISVLLNIRILITPLVSSNSSCMGTCVIYETFTKIEYDEIFVIREVIPIAFMLSITFYLILFT